jgi:DNA-binding transcriptional LysR family regulator
MNLDDVATFVRVVDRGSMSAAARELGLPKSTVSRRVSRLEEELGVRLLQRTTRKQTLTDAGVAYFDRVSGAVGCIHEAGEAAAELQDEPRGGLRITAPDNLFYLGEIVATFAALYPEVVIEADVSSRNVDLVAEGFDLALRAGKLADSTLIARKLVSSPAWLAASTDYLDRGGRPEHPSQLASHELVGTSGMRKLALTSDEGTVELDWRPRISGNGMAFARWTALAGGGIAPLPASEIMADLNEGRLERVLPRWQATGGSLYVVYPSGRHLPARTRAFRDHVIAWFERASFPS